MPSGVMENLALKIPKLSLFPSFHGQEMEAMFQEALNDEVSVLLEGDAVVWGVSSNGGLIWIIMD